MGILNKWKSTMKLLSLAISSSNLTISAMAFKEYCYYLYAVLAVTMTRVGQRSRKASRSRLTRTKLFAVFSSPIMVRFFCLLYLLLDDYSSSACASTQKTSSSSSSSSIVSRWMKRQHSFWIAVHANRGISKKTFRIYAFLRRTARNTKFLRRRITRQADALRPRQMEQVVSTESLRERREERA